MSDEPERGRRKHANATEQGRYGHAPEGAPHLSPETPPARGGDAPARPVRAQPGALPENEGREPEEDAERG